MFQKQVGKKVFGRWPLVFGFNCQRPKANSQKLYFSVTNDSIADFLTQLRNAIAIKKEFVELPYTKTSEEIAKLLKKQGLVEDYKRFKESGKPYKSLHIDLKYLENNASVISSLKRISKPGRRYYSGWSELPLSKGGRGLVIVSTSKGLMNSLDAKKKHLGGEVWAEVY